MKAKQTSLSFFPEDIALMAELSERLGIRGRSNLIRYLAKKELRELEVRKMSGYGKPDGLDSDEAAE